MSNFIDSIQFIFTVSILSNFKIFPIWEIWETVSHSSNLLYYQGWYLVEYVSIFFNIQISLLWFANLRPLLLFYWVIFLQLVGIQSLLFLDKCLIFRHGFTVSFQSVLLALFGIFYYIDALLFDYGKAYQTFSFLFEIFLYLI